MAKLNRPLRIPLDQGIHDKENTQDTPLGSLKYARNCEYRGLSRGLARRKGRSDLNEAVVPEPLEGIVQFEQTLPGGVSEILVATAGDVYKGDTGLTTEFTALGQVTQTSPGQRTFSYYDNYQFVSNGADPTVVYNGDSVRLSGIPYDENISIEAVGNAGPANITIKFGLHFTYRYWDSVNNVYSDPAIDASGKLLYVTLLPGEYESITVNSLPQSPPVSTNADTIILYASDDELFPSVFYPLRWIDLTSVDDPANSEIYQPSEFEVTDREDIWKGFQNPEGVSDELLDSGANASLRYPNDPAKTSIGHDFFGFAPAGTVNDWLLRIKIHWPFAFGKELLSEPTRLLIEYSLNGGATYDYTLHDRIVDRTRFGSDKQEPIDEVVSSGEGLVGVDISQLRVRIVGSKVTNYGIVKNTAFQIHDIRVLSAVVADSSINFFNIPIGNETPAISGFNIGQYQPPPTRIFPTIYDGHLLGVSDINGLYLAYSRVDEPEHWSTDPTIALFPYLIPFKEKEIDKIVGAERSGVYLVVLANDSVWRIDKLPVITAPEGQSSGVFAEARLGSRERVTDTVGCVGLRAYSRVQLSSDVDMVFFWSRIGPILTDGHRVWRAADHVRWDFLHEDLSLTVVENDIDNRRLLVSLRTADATENDVLYVFNYDQGHLLKGDFGIRFKVTGPWDGNIQDMALVKLSDTTHVVMGTSALATGDEAGQAYVFGQQTIDSDTGTVPRFNWVSSNIGMHGKQTQFFDIVFSVQDENPRELEYGQTNVAPDDPIEKSAIDVNLEADNIEITWDNDEVTIRCRMDKEEIVIAGEGDQAVEFETEDRVINNMSISISPGSFVDN